VMPRQSQRFITVPQQFRSALTQLQHAGLRDPCLLRARRGRSHRGFIGHAPTPGRTPRLM